MPGKTILITGCDRRYFPLLQDFLKSVADSGGLDRVDLGIFDLDFKRPERAWLSKYATRIVPARSPLEPLLPYDDNGRRPLPSLVRPYLPALFPGYEVYVYADVDVWVQDWTGIERFIEGARQSGLAICAQSHPAYRHKFNAYALRYELFRGVFGNEVAQELVAKPHINAGIFAMTAAAPHWARWAEHWRQTLRRDALWFGSGQAILTHMLYKEGMQAELLPGICNWQSHLAMPMWDEELRQFVEPDPPHEKILLMHMTDDTKWLAQSYRTRQGNVLANAQLRYDFYRRLCDGTVKPFPPRAGVEP